MFCGLFTNQFWAKHLLTYSNPCLNNGFSIVYKTELNGGKVEVWSRECFALIWRCTKFANRNRKSDKLPTDTSYLGLAKISTAEDHRKTPRFIRVIRRLIYGYSYCAETPPLPHSPLSCPSCSASIHFTSRASRIFRFDRRSPRDQIKMGAKTTDLSFLPIDCIWKWAYGVLTWKPWLGGSNEKNI